MMERVDIGDWCTLIHADAVEIVDELRAMVPDAVIMDPPYGIAIANIPASTVGGTTKAALARGYPAIQGDDTGAELARWFGFPQVLLWGADHLREQLPPGGRLLAWDKLAGLEAWDQFSDVEFAWHSEKRSAGVISHRWKGLITDRAGGDTGLREHPMQKPVRVMEWCIEQCRLKPDALILDPYMGSGTTGIAAFKRRMRFVGVEIDRRWFDVAVKRISEQTCEGPLFGDTGPSQTELTLE